MNLSRSHPGILFFNIIQNMRQNVNDNFTIRGFHTSLADMLLLHESFQHPLSCRFQWPKLECIHPTSGE